MTLDIECNGAPMYDVYILRCIDDSYYAGSGQDLKARIKARNDGRGAAYTFKHRTGSSRLFGGI